MHRSPISIADVYCIDLERILAGKAFHSYLSPENVFEDEYIVREAACRHLDAAADVLDVWEQSLTNRAAVKHIDMIRKTIVDMLDFKARIQQAPMLSSNGAYWREAYKNPSCRDRLVHDAARLVKITQSLLKAATEVTDSRDDPKNPIDPLITLLTQRNNLFASLDRRESIQRIAEK